MSRLATFFIALSCSLGMAAQGDNRVDSLTVDSLLTLGLSHYGRGSYQQCVDVLEPLAQNYIGTATSPLTADAYHALYYSYQRMGQREDMYYWGRKCLDKNADDAEIIADMAKHYNGEEKPDMALSVADPYNLRHPEQLLVARQLANACFLNMNFELAKPLYLQLLSDGLRTFDVAYSLGLCYFQEERYDSAYTFLRQAAEMNRFQNNNCLYRLGIASVKTGHAEEGVEYINKVLQQLTPSEELIRSLHRELADGYAQLGRDSLELEELKLVMVHGGYADMRVMWRVACCYESIGDIDNARYHYQQVLNIAQMQDMIPGHEREPALEALLRATRVKLEQLKE